MAKTSDLLAPAVKRLNTAADELRQFRAELDRVTPDLPSGLYESATAMSDETTNVLKRLFRLQEAVRRAGVETAAPAQARA